MQNVNTTGTKKGSIMK